MIKVIVKYFLLLCFIYSSSAFAQLKDGSYKGYSQGRSDQNHDGKIGVKVVIDNGKIDSINIITFNQNLYHKKYGKYVQQVVNELPKEIINSQSLDVDVITGATISSNSLLVAAARALQGAVPKYKDGTYSDSSIGRRDKNHSGEIALDVKIRNSKIDSIIINKYDQSIEHKKYGVNILNAKKELPSRIINTQSLSVDAISGATISSNAIILAVFRALEKAK